MFGEALVMSPPVGLIASGLELCAVCQRSAIHAQSRKHGGLVPTEPGGDRQHDVRVLQSYYPYTEWLVMPDGEGDPRLPYYLAYYFRDKPALATSWGSAEVREIYYRIPDELKAHRERMYERHPSQIANKGDHDNLCPRLAAFSPRERSQQPHFTFEFARYADQVGTNMYPDAQLDPSISVGDSSEPATNVRRWDQLQCGITSGLPDIHQSRLANTFGVAVGIIAKNADREDVICWRLRSEKPRMYSEQPHLPFTFALNITRDDARAHTLRELVIGDARVERAEELGIAEGHFTPLMPVAFCRDLARAGKPQLFLEKRARVSFETLREWVQTSVEFRGELQSIRIDDPVPSNASDELSAFVALVRGRRIEGTS